MTDLPEVAEMPHIGEILEIYVMANMVALVKIALNTKLNLIYCLTILTSLKRMLTLMVISTL